MPRRENNRPRLSVHVSFEATRLSGQFLIEAYECLAPSRHRILRKDSSSTLVAEEARVEPGREGKHA
jgi:hypothetical protein